MKEIITAFVCLMLLVGCALRETLQHTSSTARAPAHPSVTEFRNSYLAGTWTGKARDGTSVTYRFHGDGAVVWFVDEPNFKRQAPAGLRAKYTVRENPTAWEIDIYDFEHARLRGITFQGIIEPLGDRKFRMEGLPSIQGGRPKRFSEEAIDFSKTDA